MTMTTKTMNPRHCLAASLVAAAVLPALAGCRNEMYDQARYEPLEASAFFDDGMSSRPQVPGTVARLSPADEPASSDHEYLARAEAGKFFDDPAAYDHYYEGKADGKLADTFPFPLAQADVERGQQRYNIYCRPCHGATGDGKGLIVLRGFSPPPPLYGPRPKAGQTPVPIYDDLRDAPVGHFFDVMTHGHGAMYSYASRIPPDDRWRIAAFIRALQLSQAATRADLESITGPNAEEQKLLQEFQK